MKKYKASAYIIFAIVVIAAVAVIVSQITLQSQKEKSEAAETSSVSTQAVSSAKQTDTEDKNFSADESEPDTEMLETVDLMETADMIVYTYDELKEQADVIVKVKIKDDLTKENSVYRLAEPNVYSRDTGWCYSLREAEVIEVYRGGEDWHAGDTIKIQDAWRNRAGWREVVSVYLR